MSRSFVRMLPVGLMLCVLAGPTVGGAWAAQPRKTPQAWTFDEAVEQCRLNPKDAYLQYVAMMLGRNEKRSDQLWQVLDDRPGFRDRQSRRPDLFAMFTGALAVQESLQLDTMRGEGLREAAHLADPRNNSVKVASLQAPSQKSHPWAKMLAAQTATGKKIEVSPLSLCVPADQLYLEFRSLSKLLEISDVGDLWGTHLFNQAAKSAQSQRSSDRLKTQLAIQTDPLSRPFYDMVVDEVAITTGDLFFREGTDLAMVFKLKQPQVFKLKMDGYLEAAQKARADAVRSEGKIGEVDYVQVSTPDRAVSVFSAYPSQDVHIRANSKAMLERILAAIDGKTPRLGESDEFKYIRTLMVRGDEREDGLIYLSDPFIRWMVGPELKLTESRRLICYNHLRMLGHASMLYRTQFGDKPESIEQLVKRKCLPGDKDDTLCCPCGGKYSLAEDKLSAVCSRHGATHELVPCRDVLLKQVTDGEANQYKRFVDEYSRYWTRFFDPIAVRVKVSPKQYRAETIVLPLIDNTIYSTLSTALGGTPEPLDALPVPKRNIFTVALRLDKEKVLAAAGGRDMFREVKRGSRDMVGAELDAEALLMKGLGNQVSLNVYDTDPTFDFDLTSFLAEMVGQLRGWDSGMRYETLGISFLIASLNAPVYAAIPVKDAAVVDKFLGQMDTALAALARKPEARDWLPVDYDFYKAPAKASDDRVRCYALRFGPVKWRMYFARLDNALYIASKDYIIDDIIKTKAEKPKAGAAAAHAMVRVRPRNWDRVLGDYQRGWAEGSREACFKNFGPLLAAGRTVAAESGGKAESAAAQKHAEAIYGVSFFCPEGGKYEISPDGKEVRCSEHGTPAAPRQPNVPTQASAISKIVKELAGITAELTFLDDGLHAVVTVERK